MNLLQPQKTSFRLARTIRLVTALTCVVAIFQAPVSAAAGAQTGTVEGRVFNAANGTYLNNARVTVEGTSIQAFTSDSGEYQLRGVPAGTARITVNFTGQRDLVQTVAVSPATVATTNFTFNASQANTEATLVVLDKYVVESERFRNAQQIAINEERSATNIKSVVALDSLGYVSDGNIGSFVRFLPGVDVSMNDLAGVRGNPDNAAAVGVRGFGPDSTAILVDGVPLASSSMDSLTRTVTLDAVSINNASRLEIIKVATPDMPQNSPGGAINLITRGAFEQSRAHYNLTVAFNATSNALEGIRRTPGPYEPSFKTQPNVRFTASIPLSKKLGVSFSAASDNKYSITNYSRWRDLYFTARTTTASGVTAPVANAKGGIRIDNPVINRYELNDFEWLEKRLSGNVRLDWRPIPGLEFRANAQVSDMESQAVNHRSQWTYGTAGIQDWSPTAVRGFQRTATFNPGHAVGMTIDARDRIGFTTQGYLDARYRKGLWAINARLSASESWNSAPDKKNGHFSNADVTISPGRMDLVDVNNQGEVGAIRLWDINGSPMDYGSIASWNPILSPASGFRARSSESHNRDLVKATKLDVSRDLNVLGVPLALKAGGQREAKANHKWGAGVIYEMRYVGPAIPNLSLQTDYAGDVFGGYAGPQHWVDMAKVYDVYKAHPEYFDDKLISATGNINSPAINYQSRVNNTKGLTLTGTDYYGMATARLFKNRLTVIAGARQSRNDTKGYNVFNDPTAPFVKNPDGTLYRDATYPNGVRFDGGANANARPRDAVITDTALRARMQAAGVSFIPSKLELAPDGIANGSQSNNLALAMLFRTVRTINTSLTQPATPQVQLAYDITDNLKLQVAWSKETRLPNLDGGILVGGSSFQINESLTPTAVPGGDGTISLNNVKGFPEMNTSYNAKLAWYPRKGSGRYSISYYYKDVKKSWQTFSSYATDGDYDGLLASMGLEASDYPNYRIDTILPIGIPQIRKGYEIEAVQNLGLVGNWGKRLDVFMTYTSRPVTLTVRPNVLGFVGLTPVRAKWSGGVSYSARRFSIQTRFTYTESGITYNGSGNSVTMPDGSTQLVQLYDLNKVPPDVNIQINFVLSKRVRLFATGDHVLSGRTYRRISDAQTNLLPEYASWREMTNSGVRIAAGAEVSLENISRLWGRP